MDDSGENARRQKEAIWRDLETMRCWRKEAYGFGDGLFRKMVFVGYGKCDFCVRPLKQECFRLQQAAMKQKADADLALMRAKVKQAEAISDCEEIDRQKVEEYAIWLDTQEC